MVAVAIYIALAIDWWKAGKTKRDGLCVAGSGLLFIGVLLGLMAWNTDSLLMILQRGGYAVKEGGGYLARLALTLLTPFYHPDNRWAPFLIEDVHLFVGGPALSRWLAGFFVIGWVAAWFRPRRLERLVAMIWTLGMALCAVAGPNFKYLLPFLPFTLLLALSGFRIVTDFLSAKYRSANVGHAIVVVVVIGSAWGGLHDFFHRYPKGELSERNYAASAMADIAIKQVQAGVPRVLVQPGRGVDIVRWGIGPLISSGQVSVFPDIEPLIAAAGAAGAVPTGTLLLIDYPVEVLMQQPGAEKLPVNLKTINIRLLPEF